MGTKSYKKKIALINKVVYENDHLIENLIFNSKDYAIEFLEIKNCSKLQTIKIEGLNKLKEVKISKCKNDKSKLLIEIYKCKILGLEIINSDIDFEANFSSFENVNIIHCMSTYININNAHETVSPGHIGEVNLFQNSINFISITNISIYKFISVSNKFTKQIFNSVTVNKFELTFIEGIVYKGNGRIKEYNSTEMYDIDIQNCKFNTFLMADFESAEINLMYYVIFEKNEFLNESQINIFLNQQRLKESCKKVDIFFDLGSIKCHNIFNLQSYKPCGNSIIKILMSYGNESEGIMNVVNLTLDTIQLKNTNYKLETTIDTCEVEDLSFSGFNNRSTFKIINCKSIGRLYIRNSNLSEIFFSPFSIKNSILINSDSIIDNMRIYGNNPVNLEGSELATEQKHEFYRQLKLSAKKSENKYLEQEYRALEMKYFIPQSIQDYIIHYTNSISDYGTNWVKPVIILLVLNLLIWAPFTSSLYFNEFGNFDFSFTWVTIKTLFQKFTFTYWQLINPISRMSDFDQFIKTPKPINWVSIIFFYGLKIFNYILIYQILTSFRKLGGKD